MHSFNQPGKPPKTLPVFYKSLSHVSVVNIKDNQQLIKFINRWKRLVGMKKGKWSYVEGTLL